MSLSRLHRPPLPCLPFLVAVLLMLAAPALSADPPAAVGERPGGVRLGPDGSHAVSPALNDTGCRGAMIVWRCDAEGAVRVLLALDMDFEGDSAGLARAAVAVDGAPVLAPALRPLSPNRRNLTLTPDEAATLTRAALAGGVAVVNAEDPGSGGTLEDRFALGGLEVALQTLGCAPAR